MDPRDAYESEEGEGGFDSDDDEVTIIEDPHLSIQERRKELEEELSEDELAGLRPAWKDFLSQAVAAAERRDESVSRAGRGKRLGEPSVKRDIQPESICILDDSSDDEAPAPKRRHTVKEETGSPRRTAAPTTASSATRTSQSTSSQPAGSSRFDAQALVREQRLRALGLAPTTLSRTSHTAPSATRKTAVKLEDGSDGWTCIVCSLNNPVSRTRCSEWARDTQYKLLSANIQASARRAQMALDLLPSRVRDGSRVHHPSGRYSIVYYGTSAKRRRMPSTLLCQPNHMYNPYSTPVQCIAVSYRHGSGGTQPCQKAMKS